MKITYDKDADALYIKFRRGTFDRNKVLSRDAIADFDKKGNLLGLELLSVRKRIPLKQIAIRGN